MWRRLLGVVLVLHGLAHAAPGMLAASARSARRAPRSWSNR